MRKNFQPTAPLWNALVASDTRAAWMGTWPGRPEIPLRVEGQAYRGKVVFFGTYFPLGYAGSAARRHAHDQRQSERRDWSGNFPADGGGWESCWPGANLRAGRSDFKGAARLALFTFLLALVAMSFFAHHIPTGGEVS